MGLTQRVCLIIFIPVTFSLIFSTLMTNSTPQDPDASTDPPCFEESESIFQVRSSDICKKGSPRFQDDKNICVTSVCNASAASVKEKMDTTANPCDDFYKFACGSYVKNTIIPSDRSHENLFTVLADKVQDIVKKIVESPIATDEIKPFQYAKQFYQKCMDQNEIELNSIKSVKTILNQIGNWPALQGEEWKSDEFDIKNVTYKLRQMGLPYNNIFSVSLYIDRKSKVAKNSLYISYPRLSMDTEYLIKGLNNSAVKAYYYFIVNISVALGAERNFSRKEFNDSMLFEIELAKNLQNSSDKIDETSIKNLTSSHPFIPWEDYIIHIIDNENIQLGQNETIHLKSFDFVAGIEKLLKETPKRVQANYILSRILEVLSPYLSEEIQNFQLEYYRVTNGVTEKPLRWKECLNIVPNGLITAISALYIRNFPDISNIKLEAMEFAKTLKSIFINIIDESTWMDENVKLKAIEKANSLSFHMGFPDQLLDDKFLEEIYNDLTVTPSNSSLEMFLKVNKFRSDAMFLDYGKLYDTSFWANRLAATNLNAKYSPFANAINVPAVFLENESYDINKPQYMNYGSLGFLIGSEIAQGFSDYGRLYDKDGLKNDWWQLSTKTEYDKKSQCLIHQFDNYNEPKLNLQVNGSKTVENNIASNAAIRIAYMAYQKWVNENGVEQILPGLNCTSNQLFWIACAQFMCSVETEEDLKDAILSDIRPPFEFTIKGTFSNSKDFAKDFNCPMGSRMNPENKCQFW